MPKHDASTAEVLVFTFKEGLLSAVAHDLKLRVGAFSIDVADDRSGVTATFDARSLRVVCARVDGHDSTSTLADRDKEKIESNIASDVLAVKKHPEIRFVSSSLRAEGEGVHVRGTLTLAGKSREIELHAKRENGKVTGEVTIHQPDFGIKPFSAMLGALKIRPDVRVRVTLPWA
ncbi:MAG: YceI family protein [Sandaracinaceae bacterium]|nr:YceI family protein [Sandaracinaceae bacterium]